MLLREEGLSRVERQRERDGGGGLGTPGSSFRQQDRTAFCALKDAPSSHKPATFIDSKFLFDASLELLWREDLAFAVGYSIAMGKRE